MRKRLYIVVLFWWSSLPCSFGQLQTDTLYSYQQLMQFLNDAVDNGDVWRLAEVHDLFGDYHFYTADYESAFKSYTKSIDRYASIGDSLNLYAVRMALANFYHFQNLNEDALRLYHQAVQFYDRENHTAELAKAYLELAKLYRIKGDFRKEIYYLNRSVNLNRSVQDTALAIIINLDKSSSYLGLKESNKALGTAEKALEFSNAISNIQYQSSSYLALGKVYELKNNPEKALEYLNLSLSLTPPDNAQQLRDIYKTLATAQQQNLAYDSAFIYLKKYTILHDSLLNASRLEAANRLSRQYESAKKDAIIEELSQEKRSAQVSVQKQRGLLFSALIGFLAVLGGIYYIIRFYQQQIATKELINRQKEEINRQKITELENNMKIESMQAMFEGQEAERERVARDLHDSLGGLLSTVKLQFDSLENKVDGITNIPNYKNANKLLDNACQEVRDIARNMQPSALLNLGLVPAIKDLINRVEDVEQRRIDFQYYGMEERLDNTMALTVYRLVQELLNNSIKHSKSEEILIQLTKEEGSLIIMVEDEGVGFDIDGAKKGMGTENILSRVNFLKGDLSVHSEKGKGTSTLITVPLRRE